MRLRAENIDFCYNCGKKIIENLDFYVDSGEVVGIFAPSGFGKTTLTKILAGYLKPERGRVVIETDAATNQEAAATAETPGQGWMGQDPSRQDRTGQDRKGQGRAGKAQTAQDRTELDRIGQGRMGGSTIDLAQHRGYNPVQLIFQHPEKAINPKWKMKKVLAETGMPSEQLMEAMGINMGWLDRWPSELSGGEMQRFCVLRALNPHTKFLIADEMTTMLDAITQVQIWDVVLGYAREHEIGIIVISHEMPLLQRVCDRIERL